MTIELLERYIQSEVKNLHFRVDTLEVRLDRLEERLTIVEQLFRKYLPNVA